ncbi:cupredoxin domain-containing protein [Conexibacter stalactiti]|uniref:Cupredoxin domain-containing protein n=1 Tax=Conexibacter stalactiti TaxID=1940611 RepID=A0ABU4HKA8_9ACTN|nr:cupredoxin domain-containing protein [Conexibacter stalactiti]MDW5593743.1 cupredoxin domain-containing protein [Conexibacter stalactiti]MEC5034385.1 cupredoxin domain-containing protein [Conexibacter stalactiti]
MPLHLPAPSLARPPARPLAIVLAVVALLCAGCGSPAAVDVAETEPVAVAMSEFRLTPQSVRLQGEGERTFEIRNEGTMVHRFELRSEDGTRRLALGEPLRPGESQELTVRLPRGTFLMRCAQERHNTLGEHGTVTVL